MASSAEQKKQKAKEASQAQVAKINVSLEEKIGLPDYSHVRIFASVTRDVPDESDDQILEDMVATTRNILEPFLAQERELVLGDLQDKATGDKK